MPDNPSSAAQPESGADSAEFNFDQAATDNPRIKRRSLKAKPAPGLIQPSSSTISAARDLAREAPPRPAEATQPAQPKSQQPASSAVKPAEAPASPPRTGPAVTTALSRPVASGPVPKTVSAAATTTSSPPAANSTVPKTASTSAANSTTSPHGTRPATLYYSSAQRKDKEAASPMKTIPTGNQASSTSTPAPGTTPRTTASTAPASTVRPASTPSPRPASSIDYRANVERQSREQKSVGSILSYIVYALIALFVICVGLAGYGADVIFKQLNDQSTTVSALDQRYAAENKILSSNLATTQDSLVQAQAQITRQQDLIVRQQEELNRLIAATNDNLNALKTEKQSRAAEAASLRERVRDLENRINNR